MDRTNIKQDSPKESEQSWNAYCEDIWGYLDPTSKDSFVLRSEEFRVEARECTLSLDFDRLATITRAYHWVSPKVQQGDPALFFEVAAVSQSLRAAFSCSNLRLFDETYKLVSVVMEVLDAEFHNRPNSEFRVLALSIIADCKWQEPDTNRDKLWSPEWMLEEYFRHYERITSILKENPARDKTGAAIKILEDTEFLLLKVVARYLPKELPGFIDQFNTRWGTALEVREGHFLTNDPPSMLKRYYWDFEIAKLYIGRCLTLNDLDYCQERLIEAAKDELEGDRNYLLSIDLQYRFFARAFTNILEFPVGKSG